MLAQCNRVDGGFGMGAVRVPLQRDTLMYGDEKGSAGFEMQRL